LRGDALRRTEPGPGGTDPYIVRTVPGSRATKVYRCPGCDHEITLGTAHIVAWPADDTGGIEDRRHWHTGCWSGRGTRGLTRRWS
jgi:hypothetical protein